MLFRFGFGHRLPGIDHPVTDLKTTISANFPFTFVGHVESASGLS